MVGWRFGRAVLCVAALSVAQCTKARTELVVTVWSELAWGAGRDLQSLAVTVRRGSADGAIRWQQTKVLGGEVGQWQLPLSFGLYPADATDATPVWIEVLGCAARDGCVASGALVVQRAVVSYRPEQTVGLDLWLAARCRGVTCELSERCVRETGRCELASRANDDVIPLPGGVVPTAMDAGAGPVDAVARDAVQDAVVDAPTGEVVAFDAAADGEVDAAPEAATDGAGADALIDADAMTADVAPMDVAVIDASGDVATDAAMSDAAGVDGAVDVPRDALRDAEPTCTSPRMMCGGTCVDAMGDSANCGVCGRACLIGQSCVGGACGMRAVEECDGSDNSSDGRVDEGCPTGITGLDAISHMSPTYGGGSGDVYDITCPAGTFASGVTGALYSVGYQGQWQFRCMRPRFVESTSTAPYTYSIAWDSAGTAGPVGSMSGGAFTFDCPSGSVIHRVSPYVFSTALAQVTWECASWSITGSTAAGWRVARAVTRSFAFGRVTGSLNNYICPDSGGNAAALSGASGRYVSPYYLSSATLRCSAPSVTVR